MATIAHYDAPRVTNRPTAHRGFEGFEPLPEILPRFLAGIALRRLLFLTSEIRRTLRTANIADPKLLEIVGQIEERISLP